MKYHLKYEYSKPKILYITDTACVIADPEFEGMRFAKMRPLLKNHGFYFDKGMPADWKPKYDPTVRCYDNAMRAAIAHRLTYCEGVLRFSLLDGTIFNMPHGWCCTDEGEVVDPTGYKTQYLSQVEYWGFPIDLAYAYSWRVDQGYHGLLDGTPEDDPIGIHYDPPALWLRRPNGRI